MIPIGTGPLRLMLKEDGGVYLGEVNQRDTSRVVFVKDAIRVGSSVAICKALRDAFGEMAEHMRSNL
jgi:hypothetical protein